MKFNSISYQLLDSFLNDNNWDSVVFSPYSINHIMMMVYKGTAGKTSEEFEKVYGINSQTSDKLINDMIDYNKSIQYSDLQSANAEFVDKEYSAEILPEFASFFEKAEFEIKLCDFKDDLNVEKNKINQWVKNKTHDMIPSVIDHLDHNTKIVLVNVLYFKMDWFYEFDSSVYSYNFLKSDGSICNVDMMGERNCNETDYYEDNDVQIISLPYCKHGLADVLANGYSMYVILPKNDHNKKLYNIELYFGKLAGQYVEVRLPKFETEFDINLNDKFLNMGLSTLFNPNECDFGNMVNKNNNYNNLYVSKIIHKAKISCDTKGTEAVAVTCAQADEEDCIDFFDIKSFTADHTFQYHIVHDITNTILFSGVYNGN